MDLAVLDGKSAEDLAADALLRGHSAEHVRDHVIPDLHRAIQALDEQLNQEAVKQHEQLLDRVHDLNDLREVMVALTKSVDKIDESVRKTKKSVIDSYEHVRVLTKQLDRVHQTIRLLQSVIKYLSFVKKLEATSTAAFKEYRENKHSLLSLLSASSPSPLPSSSLPVESSLASLHDLPKIASYIQILEEIREENESVSLIDAVRRHSDMIDDVKLELVDFAREVFVSGTRAMNQNQISIAIRVFFSLKILDRQIEAVVATISRDCAKSFDSIDADIFLPPPPSSDDGKKYNKNSPPEQPKVSEDDVIVWMERISKALRSESVPQIEQIWNLSFILSRMRDAETQVLMEEVLREREGERGGRPYVTPNQLFWAFFTSHLKKRVNFSIGKIPEMRPHFAAVFPRMMKVLGIFVTDLLSRPIITSHASLDEPFLKKKQNLLLSFGDMRVLFEQHTQQRLISATQACFREGRSVPSKDDLSRLLRHIREEVKCLHQHPQDIKMFDMVVAAAVGNAISQSAKIFLRTISKAIPNIDPSSLLAPPSHGGGSGVHAARQLQGEIFYCLQELYKAVDEVKVECTKKASSYLSDPKALAHHTPSSSSSPSPPSSVPLPEEEVVIMTLHSTLHAIQSSSDLIAEPLCSLVFQRYLQLLQGMYSEDFGSERQVMEVNASQYMEKIGALLHSFGSDVSQFGQGDLIRKHVEELVANLVEKFILQACLLPHISSSGVLRLTKDMAQLEVAIGAFHPRFSKNIPQKMSDPKADPYQKLRAFRQLLFRDLSEISKCPDLQYIPPTLVLHHLFSLAPPNTLISPIQYKRCNLQQYSKWLAEAEDGEVWALVRLCLEEYVKKVNLLGEKEFCSVYPVLVSFPQWGLVAGGGK